MPVILRLIIFFSIPYIIYYFIHRRAHKNAPMGGAFFFDMDSLVLNTGIPYAIPFADIDCVELQYNGWELENKLSYGLWVKVVRRDGRSKRVFYKGARTGKTPDDLRAELEEKGLQVVMVDGGRK